MNFRPNRYLLLCFLLQSTPTQLSPTPSHTTMTESAARVPYHIQSKNTLFYVISTPQDKVDQEVDTKPGKDSIPSGAIVTLNPPIRGPVTLNVLIQGASGLYVSLKGNEENTKLTWAKEPYAWTISLIAPEAYVVTPGDGKDLYWFDEFNVGVGDHVEVRAGRNTKPPQNQWIFTPLLR